LPKTQKYEEKLKQMSVPTYSGPSPRCVQAVLVEPERQWRKGFVKEMSFKPGGKDWGSDRWWERRWWLWWGDMRRMRWTRRRVNTMRLT